MEIIRANDIDYKCTSVTTGIDSISFTMEGQDFETIHQAFKQVTELTVSNEEVIDYGVYKNLAFLQVSLNMDDSITVTMRIKSEMEIRLDSLEASQEIRDEAIIELAESVGGIA